MFSSKKVVEDAPGGVESSAICSKYADCGDFGDDEVIMGNATTSPMKEKSAYRPPVSPPKHNFQ